jgi:hypothetical protein
MSLSAARGKLLEAHQVVQSRWTDVRNGWNDQVGRQFEADHWVEIAPAVEAALRAIDRLSVVVTQMRHECE